MRRHSVLIHLLAAFFLLGSPLALWAEPLLPPDAPPAESADINRSPGPHDGIIVETTADMLHDWHYRHLAFDTNLSARLFTNYLDTLDPLHLHFLQSDLDEFEKYRTTLGDLTRQGDTTPAYAIFNRYMERLEQRTAYMAELLKAGPLVFTNHEEMPVSRKTAPYPKNMDEARELWRQRLREDYLQEKLAGERVPRDWPVRCSAAMNRPPWRSRGMTCTRILWTSSPAAIIAFCVISRIGRVRKFWKLTSPALKAYL